MKRINSLDEDVPAVNEDLCVEQLNVFGDVESQQAFVQGFFDDSKDVAKTIRTIIQQKKKDDVKAAKALAKAALKDQAKKPRQKKDKVTKDAPPSDTHAEADKKKPRGRKPKSKVLTSEDAFINEMVHLANGQDTIPTPVTSPAKETKPVKEKEDKPVKAKEDKPVKAKEDKPVKTKEDKPVKEKEDKPVKAKEDKPVKTKEDKVKKNNKNNTQESQQTAVSVLNLHDKQYLIDDQNLVYDFHSHLPLGTFNPITLNITESK
jgi:hypothetical protein